MSLAMDGVVRRGAFTPIMQQPREPKVWASSIVSPLAGGTGMDGLRRQRPTLLPRQMLSSMETAAVMPGVMLPTPTEILQSAPSYQDADSLTRRHFGRNIAYGLVATTLLTSTGIAASRVISTSHSETLARQDTAARTAAASLSKATTSAQAAAAAAVSQQQVALQQLLTTQLGASSTNFGMSVIDLKTGATATVNADPAIESASLYKLFVADKIYAGIDAGTYTGGQDAGGGSGQNITSCLNAMITISDNTCGRALGQIIGWGSQNSELSSEGFTATNLTGPYQQTSPHDVALLLSRLYHGTLNSPSSNAAFLSLLKAQLVNNRLPVGLPAGTTIAHKTGDLDGYMHDAGIIYGPKTDYLVVMMGKPGVTAGQFSDMSSKLWSFFEQ